MITISNLSKSFGATLALDNVSFDIHKGEVHALVGENGAGKSTLMKILAGNVKKDSGSLYIKEKEVFFKNPLDAVKAGVSIVYQELSLYPDLTVMQNIFTTREKKNLIGLVNNSQMAKESAQILNSFETEHKISPYDRVENLSIADRQIVEICRALSCGSEILILDEPNSALTESETLSLFRFIRELKMKGITIIYVSHRLEEVFSISDRISVLRDGKYIGSWDIKNTNKKEIISAMIGKKLEEVFPQKRKLANTKKILEVNNLNKKAVLKNINFFVREGEVLGFAGLDGCGIENIFKILFGLEKKDSGIILYQGKRIEKQKPWNAIKNGWALVPAERHAQGLMLEWSIKENLMFNVLNKVSDMLGFVKQRKINFIVKEYSKKLNIITDSLSKKVSSLSGGNQQKVVIARWLATNPKILILNDPTRGIDVGAKAEIYKIVDELAKSGFAILLTSSEIEEVLELSDNILVIYKGEIAARFDGGTVEKPELMSFINGAFLGE
ncbi:MAG: sugar ABC transporter ATP-binding protein [Candidatus Humimicrobiaceae bacterium]